MTPKYAVRMWKVADLKASAANPRTISRSRLKDLKRSIKADPDFLHARPVIVNVRKSRYGTVIAGHMRLLAATELGMAEIPCVEVDVDARTEKAWMVKDNVHHGSFDDQKLAELVLPDVAAFEHAMPGDQLDALLNDFGQGGPGTEEEQADAIAAKKPVTKPGDVWQLGEHRLLCGDSTDPKAFERLLGKGKERAKMTFCDPPYNVAYGDSMKDTQRGAKHAKIANDDMAEGPWKKFTAAYMANLAAFTDGAVYVCMSTKEWPVVMAAFIGAGIKWSDTIIWAKDTFTMGRADHQRQYEPIMKGKAPAAKLRVAEGEPILYGWPEGRAREWNGGRDQGDVWFFTRPRANPVHPTQKPVELVAKAITNSSSRGDVVLDCFAGGGSTLIACIRTGRHGRMLELDPGYCDAIVARYVGHTKDKALLLNGKPHEWKGPVITIEGVLDSLG